MFINPSCKPQIKAVMYENAPKVPSFTFLIEANAIKRIIIKLSNIDFLAPYLSIALPIKIEDKTDPIPKSVNVC